MDDKDKKLSNNLRTIVFIIIVLSYVVFKVLTHFDITLPSSVVNITFGIAIPLAVMGSNLNSLWNIKKSKDVSSPERRRLVYIANRKARVLTQCIILYVIIAIVILVGSSFPIVVSNIKYILSVVIATLGASIYSASIAYRDMLLITDFEADLQDRVNREAGKAKFQSKK